MLNAKLKYAILSAFVLAVAGMGDSFLYVYLPSNYEQLGISTFWVGILLSVNRFTRLLMNSKIAYCLGKFDLRLASVVAVVIASITTLAYGFINIILLLLFARILWGISFSTLRLSATIYALQYRKQGISLGLSKSITEIASSIVLIVGPVLVLILNREFTFLILTLLSGAAIFFAAKLPRLKLKAPNKKDLSLSFPSTFDMLVLLNTFAVEGMMVVLAVRLLHGTQAITTSETILVAGIYLAYRKVCLILLSPLSGWLADVFGFRTLFNYTTLLLIIGVFLVALNFVVPGIIIAFTFSAMNSSIAPGGSLTETGSALKEISDNATWRDFGAAFGTFFGSLLLDFPYLHVVLMIVLVPISFLLIVRFHKPKSKTISHGIS